MIFNAKFALIKVTKFYCYYIIVIVLTTEGRVTILILKSSNDNIIEYTISELCGGGGAITIYFAIYKPRIFPQLFKIVID